MYFIQFTTDTWRRSSCMRHNHHIRKYHFNSHIYIDPNRRIFVNSNSISVFVYLKQIHFETATIWNWSISKWFLFAIIANLNMNKMMWFAWTDSLAIERLSWQSKWTTNSRLCWLIDTDKATSFYEFIFNTPNTFKVDTVSFQNDKCAAVMQKPIVSVGLHQGYFFLLCSNFIFPPHQFS